MRTAYFDCFSGISGDMLIGALLDAGLEFTALERELGKMGVQNLRFSAAKVTRRGISATKFDVADPMAREYRHLPDLNRIVDDSTIAEAIKDRAKAIFLRLAEAEAKCHGVPIESVHFHEIGAVDTIVDVVGTLIGLEQLGIEEVVASRLNVGSGTVEFSHGTYPVPAPATAELLRDVPIYATDSLAELVTPTGAAIIGAIADRFGDMPELTVTEIGYGAGSRELAGPNLLRVFIGDVDPMSGPENDTVTVIKTNIDDMNPQLYEQVLAQLLGAGALDAYLTPIIMKKGRPAIEFSVLCDEEQMATITRIIFKHTTSIGLRYRRERRSIQSKMTIP